MAAVTSPARHAASLATSASNREPRRSKVHRAMEWLKPSSAPSSVIMSASVRARMQTPSCTSYQLGSLTTTRFTRTRHSDIVHPVSSSQLTETRDHVRSFGGYNTSSDIVVVLGWIIWIQAHGFNFTLRNVLLGCATCESHRHHHYGCELDPCPASATMHGF